MNSSVLWGATCLLDALDLSGLRGDLAPPQKTKENGAEQGRGTRKSPDNTLKCLGAARGKAAGWLWGATCLLDTQDPARPFK